MRHLLLVWKEKIKIRHISFWLSFRCCEIHFWILFPFRWFNSDLNWKYDDKLGNKDQCGNIISFSVSKWNFVLRYISKLTLIVAPCQKLVWMTHFYEPFPNSFLWTPRCGTWCDKCEKQNPARLILFYFDHSKLKHFVA